MEVFITFDQHGIVYKRAPANPMKCLIDEVTGPKYGDPEAFSIDVFEIN